MSLVSSQHTFNNPSLTHNNDIDTKNSSDEAEANLSSLLGAYTNGQKQTSMERGATAYTQSDTTSAAQYTPHQEVRSSNYTASATPTTEYGAAYPPTSARSANFPDHLQHRSYHSSNHSSSSGGMAQPTNPSIAASSPTYAAHAGQHSPYPQQDQMQYGYAQQQQHTGGAMYTQPRPDWAGYAGHAGHAGHAAHHSASHNGIPYPVSGAPTPTSAAPVGQRTSQVYSFVPIPGAQQHKRPRRRYEEIERMYKCGWQGCEKAYGTLNHLNAHVTMQSHGSKRTPEEFKEIRKEWKARKKDEEQQRKDAESARTAAVPETQSEGVTSQSAYAQANRSVQLPPIGYQPGAQVPNQYQQAPASSSAVQQLQQYGNGQPNMDHYSGYPASPYGSSNHMYSHQSSSAQPKYEH
ncbi:hypothetical protein EYC84_003577 [Monilinia fructicola]|uniref:C2H2-type domain-containing protein n=1 Tax=Monilinia fructicola TaxID=38448 RepID=A0A5M9JU44_MONFR|nr:hypothetical protein EYC84_003577 [Monilinia fructicola]